MTGLILHFVHRPLADVYDYGAVGDGVADDTVAIDDAFAAGVGVYFPYGHFIYNGAGYSGDYPVVRGMGGQDSTVILGAGKSLLASAAAYESLDLRDIHISGGFGAIRHTWAGANVTYQFTVDNCVFSNYTGAAISTLATDMPEWRITNSLFWAANDSSTIGVAFAGAIDDNVIENCAFLMNRVHIKLSPGANIQIRKCALIRYANTASNPRTDIWITPGDASQSGTGVVVEGCKLGNENLIAGDYKILIADEDTSAGTNFADRWPKLTADSVNSLKGLKFINNSTYGNGGISTPFIYTTSPNVDESTFSGVVGGSPPSYILEYRTPPVTPDGNAGNIYGPWQGRFFGQVLPPIRCTNAINSGIVNDPGQKMTYDEVLAYPGSSDRTAYASLVAAAVSAFTLASGATRAAITDAIGGTDATEVTYPDANNSVMYNAIAARTAGVPIWVEFDMKQGATSPAPVIMVRAEATSFSGATSWSRYITPLATWRRYRFRWMPMESAVSLNITFQIPNGGTIGKVQIGRVRVYHAYEPQIHGSVYRAASRTVTYSASMTPDVTNAAFQKIIVTNGSAMTINAPNGAATGQTVTFDVLNSSGGAMGAITWNAAFLLAGAFTNPASTKHRTITFYYDGTNWIETNRGAADI